MIKIYPSYDMPINRLNLLEGSRVVAMKSLFLVHIFAFLFAACRTYKILGIFSFPARSHYQLPNALMLGLAAAGHEVTVFNTFLKNETIPNYREVDLTPCFPPPSPSIFTLDFMKTLDGTAKNLEILWTFIPTAEDLKNCEVLMQLWTEPQTFDAFITESFHHDVMLLFAKKMNIPYITYVTHHPWAWTMARAGNPDNPSYVPSLCEGYGFRMSFLVRVENLLMHAFTLLSYKFYGEPLADEVVKEFLGKDAPYVGEIAMNTSLTFTYGSLTEVVPLPPSIVQIGGMHIASVKPLAKNIQKFIDESEHGVVYFCMGSLLRGESFPEEKRNAFLDAFSKIKQRVLWKWEGDVLPGKSDKIMIEKWMPQRDILAHPKVKLFISHGGLLGTSEAVYEGVPVLGIPIFGDQKTNVKALEAAGAGELLNYNDISKEVVLEKIRKILNDPKYLENAKQLSFRYKDRPMKPLDAAVYWTEYVIRHKGAHHLRSAAVDMPWYQYLLLDVIAFLAACLFLALAVIYYSMRYVFRLIMSPFRSKSAATEKKVKKN